MTPLHRCGGCAGTWTGLNACHCAACHETFSGIRMFDVHRIKDRGHGRCAQPADVIRPSGERVMFYREGMWRFPEMTADEKQARFGT